MLTEKNNSCNMDNYDYYLMVRVRYLIVLQTGVVGVSTFCSGASSNPEE
jgi:hypothetical protein